MNEIGKIKEKAICTGAVHFHASLDSLEMAQSIGIVMLDPITRLSVDLINNSEHSRGNASHLSFAFSESELPFHTDYPNLDIPPRFVLLRCIDEGALSIATEYVSLSKFLCTSLSEKLLNEPWLMQTKTGRWKPCRIAAFNREGLLNIRFSSNIMRPFFPKRSSLSNLSMAAHKLFPVLRFVLKRGDYLLIDNWSGLHRRTNALENTTELKQVDGKSRVLERVLIA